MEHLPLAAIADWLVTFAIHSTCALVAALAICLVLRRRWPVAQERILRFALWAAVPSSSLQLAFATTPLPLSLGHGPGVSAPGLLPTSASSVDPAPVDEVLAEMPGLAPWTSAELLALAALGLAFAGGVWLLRTHLRLRSILRSREPETDGRTLVIAAEVARSLGMRQSPQISRSVEVVTPIAFGCLRPEICLPWRARALDDEALRAMLAHEVAHLRRHDPVWMWFAAGLNALFPWQPLLAAVRRRWSHFVELRCDSVAAQHSSPTAVARCLLDVAEWLRPAPRVPGVVLGMAARPSALRQRVEAALHDARPGVPRRGWSLCASGLSLTALTFAAPGVDSAAIGGADVAAALPAAVFVTDAGPAFPGALRAGVALLEQERLALLDELDRLRAEARQSPRAREFEPLLALLEQRLGGVDGMCRHLRVLIDRREAQDSVPKSR